MSEGKIEPIVMPKWGLAMQEGMLADWLVEEGATLSKGQEIADIETSKIANAFESPTAGVLRKVVAQPGETLPVGALLAVVAPADVSDGDVDAFVAEFQERFETEGGADQGQAPEPSTVEAGGKRLRYMEQGEGDGPPVLFLHGFGGDHLSWMFNQEELGAERKTYALDLPGHGGSSKDVGDDPLPEMASSVVAFMDALSIGKAHLVGHSMGGVLSMMVLERNPDRVASLTLVATGGLGDEINADFLNGFVKEKRAKKLRSVLELLVADPSAVTTEMVEDVVRFKRLDGAEAALAKLRDALTATDRDRSRLRKVVEEAGVPILVVWGEDDRILPVKHSEGLPEKVRVERYPNTGHLPHMEKSSDFNAALKEHLGTSGG